ncbi:peptidylprolyl isomerase [Eisenibacter elegans]|jgi:peptidyl-prolyl cis-trans isomerase B (cyclophilin B)|uniref:peptidylprolyl isomerase n=1 Tax=Eisenibacter elegans TaxID=997 RepID=UPI000409BF8F|nr:peptidylprolyl isomerase [Eisenibacter elegans]
MTQYFHFQAKWTLAFLFLALSVGYAQNSKSKGDYLITMSTPKGDIVLRLYDQTPKHKANFLKLAQEGFYEGLLFHRVINGFMIQGGDPNSRNAQPGQGLGEGDVGYYVDAEFVPELFHKKGALAAARDNNPAKASSGCQFYIVQGKPLSDADLDAFESRTGNKYTPKQREAYRTLGGTPHLDQNYTVFGEVIEGLEVIDAIAAVATDRRDRPQEDVKMQVKVTFLKHKQITKRYPQLQE